MASGIASAFLPLLRSTGPEHRVPSWWRASTRDSATGVLNQDALSSVGTSMVRAAARRGEPLSALVVRCRPPRGAGTVSGAFFATVASELRGTFDSDEVVARDGWELVVLLPATDEVGTVTVCARLLDVLSDVSEDRGRVVIGSATRPPTGAGPLDELLGRARCRATEESERQEER